MELPIGAMEIFGILCASITTMLSDLNISKIHPLHMCKAIAHILLNVYIISAVEETMNALCRTLQFYWSDLKRGLKLLAT